MEEIIIATSNKGKVREAQEILKKFKVIPMSEIGVNIDVEEDGKTFNAQENWEGETITSGTVMGLGTVDDIDETSANGTSNTENGENSNNENGTTNSKTAKLILKDGDILYQ